jgi:hypothetical protein
MLMKALRVSLRIIEQTRSLSAQESKVELTLSEQHQRDVSRSNDCFGKCKTLGGKPFI